MGELKALSYIPQVLCAQHIKDQPVNNSDKLYFPGKGKYGGFSYLYLQPDEEKEIETVFAESLRRRGAFLEGEAPLVPRQPLASPAVTIITPVFNRERFIGQAIESVLKGKFQNFEYIVIDNGSSDRTAEVVAKYTSDPRIRLVKYNENRIAKSLNIGVRNARGKYVAQLDSDDLYTEDTLNAMVEFMEQTHCALGISYYSLIDEEGNDLPEFGEIKHLEYSRNNILRVDGAGAVRMWRKSAIMQFGGFDEKDLCDYGEDYDLVLKVSEKFQVGRVHQVLYKYRRHPDNSDIKRNPLFKLRNKNLARERALGRRKILNSKT
jgi:glycosyltransferase involved in cell wall biosynthesis